MLRISHYIKTQLYKGLGLGLVIALLGVGLASSPAGRWLEEELGLPWLFKARGHRVAPEDVVVISIDSRSSQELGLPNKPRKWPRSLHGRVVDKLSENDVSSITFDVIFDEERNKLENSVFADSIQRAKKVILFQYLKKFPVYQQDSNRKQQIIGITERLIPPVSVLQEAALGLTLFPLPKVPARVNHFQLYSPALGNAATMPVMALLAHSLDQYEIINRLLKAELESLPFQLPQSRAKILAQKDLHGLASRLRNLFLAQQDLASRLITQLKAQNAPQKLPALINALAMPDSAYLNFYGPAGSINTIPYYRILAAKPGELDLKGKAVFIGFAEEFQPEQADAFYTVFTDSQSGLDISGVEIAATAFANLLENSYLKIPTASTDILILLAWGLLLSIGLRMVSGQFVLPVALIASAVYGWLVYQQFAIQHHWLPLAIPLLIQTPLIVVGSLIWKYQDVQKERRNIRQAFGYHLPIKVVDQLARGMEHITETGQHVHGIVMATDAAQYTQLSESMAPAELRTMMNQYYEILFTPIRQAEGVVSDVIGDAALAFWASPQPDQQQRQQACQAALDIVQAIDHFNTSNISHALPTRLGLHFGEMVMGHVGAVDHYEYRAVGDIVNTATRIEGLNKLLGTRVIVSEQVLQGVVGFTTRELGNFVLVGKQQALKLYELVAQNNDADQFIDYTQFENAVHHYQTSHFDLAEQGFKRFIDMYGSDSPSEYYLGLIEQNKINEPEETYEVIKLTQK